MTVVTTSKRPVISMEFRTKNPVKTSIGKPVSTKIQNQEMIIPCDSKVNLSESRSVDLESTAYFNQVDKTIVTNVKQALDTVIDKIPVIQNSSKTINSKTEISKNIDRSEKDNYARKASSEVGLLDINNVENHVKIGEILTNPKTDLLNNIESEVQSQINFDEEFVARLVAPRLEGNAVNIRLLESSDKSILIKENLNTVDLRTSQTSLAKLEDVEVLDAKGGDTLVYDESKNSWVNHPLTRLEVLKAKVEKLADKKDFSLEDAEDVRIAGFPTKGQILSYNDIDGTWENRDVRQVEEVKLNDGILEIFHSDDSVNRVDLKRSLELGDGKDVIIESPKKGQKLAYDGHVWRNVYEEYGIDTTKLMSFISFPSNADGYDALELGMVNKNSKKASKISVSSGLSIGSKFNKNEVTDNHLVVGEAVGIGINNPDKALVINSGVSGESGLKFTKLKSKKLEGEAIGVNSKGEVILIKNVGKFSGIVKCKNDGDVIINHNLNLTEPMAMQICCLSEGGDILNVKILEATSNSLKINTGVTGLVRATIVG